ncbi:MAG: glycosyltransferase family 2 protein [Legionellales bacterium]
MSSVSVIVIVKNEEDNLRRCLRSVQWANEIIVLDSGSLDNSVAVAKEFTDKVFQTDWEGYGVQKQRALERATSTWVLNLDADESVTEELKTAICSAIEQDHVDAYRIPILLNFYGKSLYYSWSPKRHIRLFKRLGAKYSDNIIHEAIILPPKAKTARLKKAIQHHSFQDISHALHKMNTYSSYSATMRKKNRAPSFIKSLFGSWWMFFRCYIIQGGILEGRDGFVLAVLSAQGSFYRGIKMLYPDQKEFK